MKKSLSNGILILVFLTGLSLLLYPTVSNYWNSVHQSRAIASYAEAVEDLNANAYKDMLQDTMQYNEKLFHAENRFLMSEADRKTYDSLLNITGNGAMGYIKIPTIACELPIYHGIQDTVLQIAVGHIEGTSLPVGGESTHCVLSGHRGLPSAKLFSDLDQVKEGDLFMIYVLDEVLTYEIDQIRIVLPEKVDDLDIEKGKDLCTLVTCTPYGINSHRLLVRGHRVENIDGLDFYVQADALQVDPTIVASVFAVPILVLLLIWLLVPRRKRMHQYNRDRRK
ncbi:MAG: class C sortase [Firmicutes bacterium]|nr:class C sortase [Bacillota bacterium]